MTILTMYHRFGYLHLAEEICGELFLDRVVYLLTYV